MHVKKGDNIIVQSGKDKGKKAKILRAFPSDGRVLVECNVKKKHQRPRSEGKKGEVISIPTPIAVDAVLLFCTACNKGVRTKNVMVGDKKMRACVSCGAHFA